MKLIDRLALRFNRRALHWQPVEDMAYPPHLCNYELKRWFVVPQKSANIIYATLSTNKPVAKHLQDAYMEVRQCELGFNVDLRGPWERAWHYVPTLLSLDDFLTGLNMKVGKKYYVWFEVD